MEIIVVSGRENSLTRLLLLLGNNVNHIRWMLKLLVTFYYSQIIAVAYF